MDINPTKLVKRQGLAKFLSEVNFQALGINFQVNKAETENKEDKRMAIE